MGVMPPAVHVCVSSSSDVTTNAYVTSDEFQLGVGAAGLVAVLDAELGSGTAIWVVFVFSFLPTPEC